jgi:hypothetical protein
MMREYAELKEKTLTNVGIGAADTCGVRDWMQVDSGWKEGKKQCSCGAHTLSLASLSVGCLGYGPRMKGGMLEQSSERKSRVMWHQ